MSREANYNPISDLARLLCSAQRDRGSLPGLDAALQRLEENLDLSPLAYADEAEAAIIDALDRT